MLPKSLLLLMLLLILISPLHAQETPICPQNAQYLRRWEILLNAQLPLGNAWNFTEIAVNPNGEDLAVARGNELAIYDAQRLTLQTQLTEANSALRGRYSDIEWSSDGNLLAAVYRDDSSRGNSLLNTIQIWSLDQETPSYLSSYSSSYLSSLSPREIAWSPQGFLLAGSDRNGNILLWDVPRRMAVQLYENRPIGIQIGYTLGWSPNNQYLAAADVSDRILRLHTFEEPAARMIESPDYSIGAFSWSADGAQIAVGNPDNSLIRLYDVSTGVLLRTLQGSTGRPFDVQWSPDGRTIARATSTGFFLWDVTAADDQPTAVFVEDIPPFMRIAWSPDSRYLFSVDLDGSVYKWDVETGCVVAAALTDWSTIPWLN